MRAKDRLRDPFNASVLVLAALGVGGVIVLWLTWRSVAPRHGVAEQIAFVVSGGLGGVALVCFAVGVLVIQTRRRAEARAREQMKRVLARADELVEIVRRRSQEGAS